MFTFTVIISNCFKYNLFVKCYYNVMNIANICFYLHGLNSGFVFDQYD